MVKIVLTAANKTASKIWEDDNMSSELKCYLVERKDKSSWCEDYAMVVMAYDELWAEKIARESSSDFRKSPLKVTEVNSEGKVLVANVGA